MNAAIAIIEFFLDILGAVSDYLEHRATKRRAGRELTSEQKSEARRMVRFVREEAKKAHACVILYPTGSRFRCDHFADPLFQQYVSSKLMTLKGQPFKKIEFLGPDWLDSEWSFTAYLSS